MIFLWKCGSGRAAAKESWQKHHTDFMNHEAKREKERSGLSYWLEGGGIMSKGSASLMLNSAYVFCK